MPLFTKDGTPLQAYIRGPGHTLMPVEFEASLFGPGVEMPVDTEWLDLFAARNLSGLDAWYAAHTGHRVPTTRSHDDEIINDAWLNAKRGNGNVSYSNGRWIVQQLHANNVRVSADNVTFRDCVIEAGGGYHGISPYYGTNPTGIIIEYCTISGQGADWLGIQFPSAVTVNQIVARRNNITGFRCGIQIIGGFTAEENWIHDLYYDPVDPHVTSMSIRARNVIVRRNRLTDGNSSALAFYNETTPYTNILAIQNIISTQNATWEATYLGTYPHGSNNVRLTGNLFERGALAYEQGNFSEVIGNLTIAGAPVA